MKPSAFAATLMALLLSCCGTSKPPMTISEGAFIADLALTLDYHDAAGVEEYYEVGRDGSFGFGGGMDARFERTSWTTQLGATEMNALRDLIMHARWFDQEIRSTKQPKDTRYAINVKCDGHTLDKRVHGASERIEPVRAALKDIANRRLQEDLDRQPRPSIERQPAATQPR